MQKRRFVALALAAALTTMGVGYAAWTDSVTINATVATGDLNVPMYVNSTSEAFSTITQILGASNIEHQDVTINTVTDNASTANVKVNTLEVLKEGNFTYIQSDNTFNIIFHNAKLQIENLYPGASFTDANAIKIPVLNAGTIPAKYACVLGDMKILDKNGNIITNNSVGDGKTMLQLVKENLHVTIVPEVSPAPLAPGATQEFIINVSLEDNASDIFEEISIQMDIKINSSQLN